MAVVQFRPATRSSTGQWFRPAPLVAAALVIEPLLRLGREPARWLWRHGPAEWADHRWIFVGLACVLQGVVGVAAILLARRLRPQARTYLQWPTRRSSVGLALALGVAMALVMLLADHWPELVGGRAPDAYSTDPIDAAGWIVATSFAPLGEETLFRGFLVGVLATYIPGRVRIGRVDLPVAGCWVAVLFALVHWHTFLSSPLPLAVAQQAYAVIWGLVYVWLMERSGSLLAPVVAHAASDAVEVALVILWRLGAGA